MFSLRYVHKNSMDLTVKDSRSGTFLAVSRS